MSAIASAKTTPEIQETNRSCLKIQLILNSNGIALFKNHRSMSIRKLKKASGAIGEGIVLDGFQFKTLKSLLRTNSVEEIGAKATHFLESKTDIIDITKMVIFTWLNGKVGPALAAFLLGSKPLIQYNRSHRPAIRSINHIGRREAIEMMQNNTGQIGIIKHRISEKVLQQIEADQSCKETDKNLQRQTLDMFRDFIDERIWCLNFILSLQSGSHELVNHFSKLLHKFLKLATGASYYALALLELVEIAEGLRFEHAIQNLISRGVLPQNEQHLTSKNRSRVLHLVENGSAKLAINWHLQTGEATHDLSRRLTVNIESPVEINSARAATLSGQLNQAPLQPGQRYESLEDTITNIQLIYWQRLREICTENGMHLSAHVNTPSQYRPSEFRTSLII